MEVHNYLLPKQSDIVFQRVLRLHDSNCTVHFESFVSRRNYCDEGTVPGGGERVDDYDGCQQIIFSRVLTFAYLIGQRLTNGGS